MNGTVVKTFVYPIKGMPGIEMDTRGIVTDVQCGIVGDRMFAVYRKPFNAPTEWKPKGQFHVCMNTEGMATPTGLTESDLDYDYRINPDLVQKILLKKGLHPETCSLVNTEGKWNMADNNKPYVSFLNLASVRDLEQVTGLAIDPLRFRMNVWVEGLEPWAELDYQNEVEKFENRIMLVGNNRLSFDGVCERCKAIEQCPERGTWDMSLLELIGTYLKKRGYKGSSQRNVHTVMGWFAIPNTHGAIQRGQEVHFGGSL